LTLSLLASESVKDAKEHLKIIIDSDGDFSGEGYKLEQALKNIE
jgi:hypothetical protein